MFLDASSSLFSPTATSVVPLQSSGTSSSSSGPETTTITSSLTTCDDDTDVDSKAGGYGVSVLANIHARMKQERKHHVKGNMEMNIMKL